MLKKAFKSFSFLFVVVAITSCTDSEDPKENSNYRAEMLTDIADNRILPGYEALQLEVSKLLGAIETFEQDNSQSNYDNIVLNWKSSFQAWQKVAPYNIGPAAEEGLQKTLFEEIALFPADTAAIEAKIANGNIATNDFERDTRGLLAMEYLIFYSASNDPVFTLANNTQKVAYLKAICLQMKARIDDVSNGWKNGYRQEFISDLGTDAGSSISEFYNAYLISFERIKNFKIELPIGLSAGLTGPDKSQLEAPYSNESFKAVKSELENIMDIWRGNENTKGFKFYLQNTEGGESLISATETQMAAVNSVLDRFPADYKITEAIDSNNMQDLIDLHTEIQKLTRYLKSDLSSLMGIAITFNSGDGD